MLTWKNVKFFEWSSSFRFRNDHNDDDDELNWTCSIIDWSKIKTVSVFTISEKILMIMIWKVLYKISWEIILIDLDVLLMMSFLRDFSYVVV